jgi:hypothetical protein
VNRRWRAGVGADLNQCALSCPHGYLNISSFVEGVGQVAGVAWNDSVSVIEQKSKSLFIINLLHRYEALLVQ